MTESANKAKLWVKGCRIIDPVNRVDEIRDVYVEEGVYVDDPGTAFRESARCIDATGLCLAPSLTDLQVHLREPGDTHKETIRTGTQAAAKGGFTRVVCMPNTRPPCDNPGNLRLIHDIIERDACIEVYPTGCITVGSAGEQLAPIGSLKNAGAIALSDGGHCIQNSELMRRALEYARMLDMVVLDHCQDTSLTQKAVMHEGVWSLKLGLRGWPAEAEDLMVSRDVILSEKTGAKVHLQNITSGSAVDIIQRAKNRGVKVTAEVTPHHLSLTDACVAGYESRFKMNPPLRTEEDRRRLIEGLCSGVIDCIACDHAPHNEDDKDMEFDYAPFGVIGLETAFGVVLTHLHHEEGISLIQILEWMSSAPDRILGLAPKPITEGVPADFILFDPAEDWEVKKDGFLSISRNSPWIGRSLKGRVRATYLKGREVYGG